jgi:hypothetical protein
METHIQLCVFIYLMKRVGFMTNHISYGGTEVALYDYAHYNETLLGNVSVVITRDLRSTHGTIYSKFEARFPVFYIKNQNDIDQIVREQQLDVVYVIKSGERDWYVSTACKCSIHCVFVTNQPHGNVYAAISPALNNMYGTDVPIVPHMINVSEHNDSFRNELQIPEDAIVLGRYGSYDTFDIPMAHESVMKLIQEDPNIYFIAMNTKPFFEHPRVIYLPITTDNYVKRKFINTCDMMLHARFRGETFGLSCGEFAVCKKPILTFKDSLETAHIDILGKQCHLYSSANDIVQCVQSGRWKIDMTNNGYMQYTPDRVMKIFQDIML